MASDRFIFSLIEQTIIETNMVEIYPYNKVVDLKVGDMVECSYISGIFEIIKVEKDYFKLKCLTKFRDINFLIGKNFVKKALINKKIIGILYHD